MISHSCIYPKIKATSLHFGLSFVVVVAIAIVVFFIWYPYPYQEISEGGKLFVLVASIDIVCGPVMTFILFNNNKKKKELVLDFTLVGLLQIGALAYGTWVTWQARPLYLVLEVDRFKAITSFDIDKSSLKDIPLNIQPYTFGGVRTVAIRPPKSVEEKNTVLLEALSTGRDYAERPEFYIPYEGASALKSLDRAKPLAEFLNKYPSQAETANQLAKEKSTQINKWKYLPIVGRQEWIALLGGDGQIQGFLKGDGF